MTTPGECVHCGAPVLAQTATADLAATTDQASADSGAFCCGGCRAAYHLVHGLGLERYYELREGTSVPAQHVGDSDLLWMEPMLERALVQDGVTTLHLGLHGITCAACIWLINALFAQKEGAVAVQVVAGTGELHLSFERDVFDVSAFLKEIASFGYRAGPVQDDALASVVDSLLVRFGVAAALTLNSMVLSLSFSLGLHDDGFSLSTVFAYVEVVLSFLVLLVGAPEFLRGAWAALRRGMLHLDLPIAIGMLLAFFGSLGMWFSSGAQAAYFDTVNIFISLMLLGRILQRRVVSKNRRLLGAEEGLEGVFVRRLLPHGNMEVVGVQRIREGDELLLSVGELTPVAGRLLDETAVFSLEWMSGESDGKRVERGEDVQAGAINRDACAARVVATEDFADSAILRLLSTSNEIDQAPLLGQLQGTFAAVWVAVVLALAGLGAFYWWPAGPERALEVAVAVLVVSCPCALGLAAPLAMELSLARLRAQGVFVRRASFLARALDVRRVLLDKTGTLTDGTLRLLEPQTLHALNSEARRALFQMAARSNHPKSRSLFARLQSTEHIDAHAQVVEEPAVGMRYRDANEVHWELVRGVAEETAFLREGRIVCAFHFAESLRKDAIAEVQRLHQAGYSVEILSGDDADKVRALAKEIGIPSQRAFGGLRPADKVAHIVDGRAEADVPDGLMLGDGINDAPAFGAAHCAGTPSIDRPILPTRGDFLVMGGGLGPISFILSHAKRTRHIVMRNLAVAFVYNVVVIALALAGQMDPLLCAILMPLSSAFLVALTAWSFRQKATEAGQSPTETISHLNWSPA